MAQAILIKDGLIIMTNKSIYKNIKNEPYIKNNFKLKVTKLNKNIYKIYFKDLKNGHILEEN